MQDVLHYLWTAECLGIEDGTGPGKPQVGLVREDAQQDAASGDLGDAIGDRFGHRVDGVGSHRIAHIYDQMCDDIRAAGCLDQPDGQFSHASTQAGEHGILGVGQLDELCTGLQQPQARRTWVRDIDDLHLRLHDGLGARGEEPAVYPGNPGRVARRRNDGRFLGGHRHQEVTPVDREVQGYPQGNAEDTDSVLDHMGSLLQGQTLLRPQDIERRRLEPGRLGQQLVSGIDLKITKSSEPARTDHGDYLLHLEDSTLHGDVSNHSFL